VQKAPIKVSIAALQEFDALFDTHQYSRESWENGKRKLPRITCEKMTDNWQKDSRNLPVEAKKLFFTPDGTPYFNGQ
jgi:Bax protein